MERSSAAGAPPERPIAEAARTTQALCKRTWWVFLIAGIALVVFGVLALISPRTAFLVLSLYFAASVLVNGAVYVVGALRHRDHEGWWVILLLGLLTGLAGAYALFNPPVSMAAFVYLVGFMAIFFGATLGMLGYKVRKSTQREWILYLAAVLSMLWGLLIFMQPVAGAYSIVYTVAAWSLVIGILQVFFAFRARNFVQHYGAGLAAARARRDT